MAAENKVTITVDGTAYTFYPERITAEIARQVRQASGMSVLRAVQSFESDPDIDVVAVVCYAAALQQNMKVEFASIEQSLSYGSEITVDAGVEDDDGPET